MTATTTSIPFGKISLDLVLPDTVTTLTSKKVEEIISPSLFGKRLHQYLIATPIDLENPRIVVADKTRLCGYPEYLPILTETLQQLGAKQGDIKFIIAYGTHPFQSEEECLRCYGSTYEDFEFIHHSSNDITVFKNIGVTQKGTPIRVRNDLLQASSVITMGAICHHYFAGYGGGRKLLFPGCGETTSIYTNHALFLEKETKQLSTHCQPGNLQNNPISDDLFDFEDSFRSDLAIHAIMDEHGQVCDVEIGQDRDTFLKACARHAKSYEHNCDSFNVVVASCGGYPKDINLIQAHKAIHNSSMFVKDGGELVVYCACDDNVGSTTLLPWFEYDNFSQSFDALQKNYQGNGGTALSMMTKTKRITISLVTNLSEQICNKINVDKATHPDIVNKLSTATGHIAYIPNGSLLVRKQST